MSRADSQPHQKISRKSARISKQVHSESRAQISQPLSTQQALDVALKHHIAGNLAKAKTIYQQVLNAEPDQPDALNLLGVIAHQVGNSLTAVNLIEKALVVKPDFADAHSNLGLSLQQLGRLDEAADSYRKALAFKPEYAEAHYNLGVVLRLLGNTGEAVTSYHRALTFKSDYADAYYNLGIISQELGNPGEAIAHYQKALAINPNYEVAHNNLGGIFKEQGRLDEAADSYRKALSINPDYAEAYYNLGVVLHDSGRLAEAVTNYQNALELNPDYSEVHNNLSTALQDLGKTRESVAIQQKAFASRTGIVPTKNGELSPAATAVFLELTNKCNFHCAFCPSDSQKRNVGFMDLEVAKRTYREIAEKKLVQRVNLHLMGEPTLHPKLIEVLKIGAQENVQTELVTNGSTLVAKTVPKILDALYGVIIASHMTPTEESYPVRGKTGLSWERYIGNIRLLVREYMKRLAQGEATENSINIRVMVTKDTKTNVSIIESSEEARDILMEWIAFVSEIEKELSIPPIVGQNLDMDDLFRGNLYASTEYKIQQGITLTFWRAFTFANTRVDDDYQLKTLEKSVFCPHPFRDVGILWNGDVTLCCLDHDGQLKIGNLRDASVETMMQSEEAQDLRASMLGRSPLPLVCQTCQARPVVQEN